MAPKNKASENVVGKKKMPEQYFLHYWWTSRVNSIISVSFTLYQTTKFTTGPNSKDLKRIETKNLQVFTHLVYTHYPKMHIPQLSQDAQSKNDPSQANRK